ncbi:heat -hock protein GrpE [Thiopseudomonas alkaliphila]|uniref:Protein GrpE n=1 Tax=Thiopseudomonas alkaliphila TaxID=1697053 RepID=A0A0K1XFP5_9GAMM|nr:nucleotide exchange factor GrpE [Thiopseudomonas alkaliphila]AKX45654.1 heat -hock protein GrpE [Thiopseudomonas alkaliphila]AKX46855.1 heat -hock protein GrpE [Thiopseudomonas alkaliphila]AKX48925.1 heat -hock protein GrpE [Thiopseudomonas alkaliphila]AKX50685.1 heat -hock protein GrpE [Thiopseudomonas alkaliphila]AKX54043.1 heat -hock protein GrpE [Thiopseudomonas alkaliphila]
MTEQQKPETPEVEVDEALLESEAAEAPEPAVENDLEAQLAALTDQLAMAKDQELRLMAEVQNTRRRADQDVEKAHKFALEKFAKDLLAVVDTLERALEVQITEDTAVQSMREGIELTLKLLLDTLKRHQVEQISPEGQPFDPELHQAISMESNAEVEPNSVVKVFQKGYSISGRLLRPAMVVVSQ